MLTAAQEQRESAGAIHSMKDSFVPPAPPDKKNVTPKLVIYIYPVLLSFDSLALKVFADIVLHRTKYPEI